MRVASVVLAVIASGTGLIFPFLLARQPTGLNQSILVLMMAGIAGAFIFGAGFAPAHKALRLAIQPWLTWTLMIGSFVGLMLLR